MQITQTTLENMLEKITTCTSNNTLIWNNYMQSAIFSDNEKVDIFLESKKIIIRYIDNDNKRTKFLFDNDKKDLMDESWFSTKYNSLCSAVQSQMSGLEQTTLTSFLNKMS